MTTSPKIKTGGAVVPERLLRFFERIERLEEERAAISSDIRDIFSEAKGVGYDTKTMRKVLALRKLDPAERAEQEAILDTYLHALGMIDRVEDRVASGEPITRATEAEGYSRATYYRVSQRRVEATNETFDTPPQPSDNTPIGNDIPAASTPAAANAGGDDDRGHLTAEPEVARAVPPATDAELVAQRESWVRAEMAFGSDADEAAERAALRASSPERVAEQKPDEDLWAEAEAAKRKLDEMIAARTRA